MTSSSEIPFTPSNSLSVVSNLPILSGRKDCQGGSYDGLRALLGGRTTTLSIQGKETEPFEVEAGVPQGSTLSPILFLLYASGLLDICNQPGERLSAAGFADNTNIFTHRSYPADCFFCQ